MSDQHQNLEAEEHVLGAMLLSPRATDAAEEVLGPKGSAFYRLGHQVIYRAILALRAEQKPTDLIAVHSFLVSHGMIVEAGGEGRLREIAATVPAAGNVAHYARIVMENAQLREIVTAAHAFIALAGPHREGRTVDELHDEMERVLVAARDAHAPSETEEHTAFELAQYLDHRMRNPQTDDEGIRAPFSKLPRLQGGRLYVLAGYQADGKTALIPEFIKGPVEDGKRVGFATYEMGWKDVAVRIAASLGAPAKQLETGRVSEVDRPKVAAAIARLATMNVKVAYDPRPTVTGLARWQRRNRFDLLVIDHLHQFPIDDPRYERQYLEKIIREIQALSVAENVPILLLAQLSRVGDPKKPFPRPSMASLRGTAMIEALAWCVWFVWRERDKKNLPTSQAEFITAKNRSGRTGSFGLVFNDRQVRFTESTETELPA